MLFTPIITLKKINIEPKEKVQSKFLVVNDIEWIGNFVDKNRQTWTAAVRKTLTTISSMHKLPISHVKSKSCSSTFSTAFSIEAINILKEKMEKHPEHFVQGRMLKW